MSAHDLALMWASYQIAPWGDECRMVAEVITAIMRAAGVKDIKSKDFMDYLSLRPPPPEHKFAEADTIKNILAQAAPGGVINANRS